MTGLDARSASCQRLYAGGASAEGDAHAGDLLELVDEGALSAALVDVGVVEVCAEVAVVGVGVGQKVPR